MKSDSEEFCKTMFDIYLMGLFPDSSIFWEDVKQKDEPPDYYLFVDGIKYAVEVTRLMWKINVGANNPLPPRTIRDLLREFVVEVESTARAQNYLHGVYLVIFPKPIDNFESVRSSIQSELLNYIQQTQRVINAPSELVYKNGRQKCVIEKMRDDENKVNMGGPSFGKREGEIFDDTKQLLAERLSNKEIKLKNINYPKILLLHDEYPFSDLEAIKANILSIPSLPSYHTVFITGSSKKSAVLYSQDKKWKREIETS